MPNYPGIYRGSVFNAADPKKQGRLRLLVPQVLGDRPTGWAEPALPVAKNYKPKPGSRLWVMFEGGDPNLPMYMSKMEVKRNNIPAGEVTTEHIATGAINLQHLATETVTALQDHSHPHTHNYAAPDHTHPAQDLSGYATTTDLSTGLATKSDTTHNHDGTYAPATHTHNGIWQRIETKTITTTLAGGIGNLVFSSIPTTYSRLRLVAPRMRHTSTTSSSSILAVFNGDTAASYGNHLMYHTSAAWTGTTVSAATYAYLFYAYFYGNSYMWSRMTAEFTNHEGMFNSWRSKAEIPAPGSTYTNYPHGSDCKGQWSNGSKITSISIYNSGSFSWEAGTKFILYGIID